MKFCTTTLGCKVNQVETQAVESMLISNGHVLAKPGEGCDVCIINTCAVTDESVRKSRQAVRRMKKLEPDALVAVCGCLSQLESDAADKLGADIVGGSGDRRGFALEIEKRIAGYSDLQKDLPQKAPLQRRAPRQIEGFERLPLGGSSGKTRAFLKIQDGCDNYCAYCVIPYARGAVRSLPLESAVSYARELVGQGFKEIVITGIEISSYGKDLGGGLTIIDAIREISGAAQGARIRLGSLAPGLFTKEFCKSLAEVTNLCDHFHFSLQSGCDETLFRMGRKYKTKAVESSVLMLRQLFPDCGITADLITGFPGETDEEFERTLSFIKSVGFSDMHVFPFSPRKGTPAAQMPGQIKKDVRRERARIVIEAAADMTQGFFKRQIGKTVWVLFERERYGYWVGHSGNYLEVTAEKGGGKNDLLPVKLTKIIDGKLWGEIL